jgi:uncharacterized membrane protein HdeD (DUF308 family)
LRFKEKKIMDAVANNPRPWWLVLMQGIALTIIGIALLWSPGKNTVAETWVLLVALLGLYWIFVGIFDIVAMFIDHSAWAFKLFMGVISILAGSYIVMYPIASALVLPQIFVLVLGLWGIIQGTIALVLAFKGGGWGLGIIGGIGLLFGLILVGNYSMIGMGLTFLWTAAVFALIGGIAMIVQAFRMR